MDLSNDASLKSLFQRCTDPSISEEARLEAASLIAKRYPYQDLVGPLGDLIVDPTTMPAAASFALRVLYVGMRKLPQCATTVLALLRVIANARVEAALRTQAFIHLLLFDIDTAELAAVRYMPTMMTLVRAERLYPTIRRGGGDAAYEEATLKLLFP